MNVWRHDQEYLPGLDEGVQALEIKPTQSARQTGVFEPVTNHVRMLVARLVAIMLAALVGLLVSSAAFGGTVVSVNPGDDLDAKASAAPAGATIWVHGKAGVATYLYTVDRPIELKAGQTLIGDVGTTKSVGPAVVPVTSVGMKAASTSMSTMLQPKGDPIRIAWFDINVAGAQKAITGPGGGPNLEMDHVKVHGAKASGIGQYRGSVFDSEIYGNGTDLVAFDGTVSGIKCNYACEVARSYVHHNPGNGIWCDVGCQSVANQPNGFYVHDNVAGDNGRHGIFYENSPKPSLNWGDSVKALITNNTVYGNGTSGISVSDSASGSVRSNTLGKTLSGAISHNAGTDIEGIELHSSGRSDKGIQKNALVNDNTMNGELIEGTGTDRDGTRNTGCGDNGNVCTNNS
jgi:parallel beta-helix repeat protein